MLVTEVSGTDLLVHCSKTPRFTVRKRQRFVRKRQRFTVRKRQRRLLISAQGWSVATTVGNQFSFLPTLKGFAPAMNPFRVKSVVCFEPKVVATLQPWAGIGKRLRRIYSTAHLFS